MPELLNEQIRKQIKGVFQGLQNDVEIVLFTSEKNCDFCNETRQLLEEVISLSDKLGITVYDLDKDTVEAEQYKINKAPGFSIMAKVGEDLVDYGIRFYGIPSGHEFTSLINDLTLVASRQSMLSPETVEFLKSLTEPVNLQVFVTPT